MAKVDRVDGRLAGIEQQLVLNQNELARHGRLIEEVNNRCLEKLGLGCLPESCEGEEGNEGGE